MENGRLSVASRSAFRTERFGAGVTRLGFGLLVPVMTVTEPCCLRDLILPETLAGMIGMAFVLGNDDLGVNLRFGIFGIIPVEGERVGTKMLEVESVIVVVGKMAIMVFVFFIRLD